MQLLKHLSEVSLNFPCVILIAGTSWFPPLLRLKLNNYVKLRLFKRRKQLSKSRRSGSQKMSNVISDEKV